MNLAHLQVLIAETLVLSGKQKEPQLQKQKEIHFPNFEKIQTIAGNYLDIEWPFPLAYYLISVLRYNLLDFHTSSAVN